MATKSKQSVFTLIGVDIEGSWNVPLLENAANLSSASLKFAHAELPPEQSAAGTACAPLEMILDGQTHVIACESGCRSTSLFDFPAPKQGNTALLVGNELSGLSPAILSRADHVISIPMYGQGLSSINVAAASAVALYGLDRDLARNSSANAHSTSVAPDLLIVTPGDPSELGSLLRSAWAFGWKKVYLLDEAGDWFSDNRETVLASRSAARREKNPLAVLRVDDLDLKQYDQIVVCDGQRHGTPLSRLQLGRRAGRMLVVYGGMPPDAAGHSCVEKVYVDFRDAKVVPCFRHAGSVLLSVLSRAVKRKKRG